MKWLRTQIADLEPYVPGRQPAGIAVKLNANENPYSPSSRVFATLADVGEDSIRLYPDATAAQVRETAAEVFGVEPDEVIVGNGSDDVLTMIMRAFLDPGDQVAVVDPTYTLYETLAAIQGATMDVHPLEDDYSLPEGIFSANAKLAVLPNPNAQTGTLFPDEAIRRLCGEASGVVVVDEAYAQFAGVTAIPFVREFDNLLILRSLSKSHSLAGLRVGFGFGCPGLIAGLMKVKDSYNVNAVSQAAAIEALRDHKHLAANTEAILATRAWFSRALADQGWQIVPSAANFVLAKPPTGPVEAIIARLESLGYFVRHFTTPRLRDKMRITIGTDEQMRGFLKCLDNTTD